MPYGQARATVAGQLAGLIKGMQRHVREVDGAEEVSKRHGSYKLVRTRRSRQHAALLRPELGHRPWKVGTSVTVGLLHRVASWLDDGGSP
jgi:hypothetical protein